MSTPAFRARPSIGPLRTTWRVAVLVGAAATLGACVVGPPYNPYQSANPYGSSGYPADSGYGQNPPVNGQVDYSGGGGDYGGGQVYVQATVAPPPLPVYEQPPCPVPGYLWTPGYWAYGPEGYFWVPGTWVMPPAVGLLWTPGYWGWSSGIYLFHQGYWGPQVGFYGGINYGGGYFGLGYVGGRWDRDRFEYNRAVSNVNVNVIRNTYYNNTVINNTVINNTVVNQRVSYVGGPGGVRAAPTRTDQLAARQARFRGATRMQLDQVRAASRDRAQFVRFNGGRPPVAATPRPQAFTSPHAVPARGAVIPPRNNAPAPYQAQPPRNYPAPGTPAQRYYPTPSRPGAASPPGYAPRAGYPGRPMTQPNAPAYQARPPAYQPRPPAYQARPPAYQPRPPAYQPRPPAYQPRPAPGRPAVQPRAEPGRPANPPAREPPPRYRRPGRAG